MFATGKHAKGICDRCGGTFMLNALRSETVNQTLGSSRVCPSCFDPDHPQLRTKVVTDKQALRDPRPDSPDRTIIWTAEAEAVLGPRE